MHSPLKRYIQGCSYISDKSLSALSVDIFNAEPVNILQHMIESQPWTLFCPAALYQVPSPLLSVRLTCSLIKVTHQLNVLITIWVQCENGSS